MAQGVRKLVAVARIGGAVHSLEQLFKELAGNSLTVQCAIHAPTSTDIIR